MLKKMKMAVPDLVSNSYFPAIAAVELGFFKQEGLDPQLELIFPNFKTYEALREGSIDFVAGPVHAALKAFPDWHGIKLLASLAQGMFWLLVMRADIAGEPGDVNVAKGRTIGAAPLVDLGLKHLLTQAGVDLERDRVNIVEVPGAKAPGVSFGVVAAAALAHGELDGFWANAMGADNSVRQGIGRVMLDVRRGLGPKPAFHYTMAALATSDRVMASDPEMARAAVRAIVATQRALQADVSLATRVGQRWFPAEEASAIANVVARDLPFYSAEITQTAIDGLNGFSKAVGLLDTPASYEELVPLAVRDIWTAA